MCSGSRLTVWAEEGGIWNNSERETKRNMVVGFLNYQQKHPMTECCSLLLFFGGRPLPFSFSLSRTHTHTHTKHFSVPLSYTHTHTQVWLPSLLCHFEFTSHLFHGLIRASDDRRMRWGRRSEGKGWRTRGLGIAQLESLEKDAKLKTGVVNIYFEGCTLKTFSTTREHTFQSS